MPARGTGAVLGARGTWAGASQQTEPVCWWQCCCWPWCHCGRVHRTQPCSHTLQHTHAHPSGHVPGSVLRGTKALSSPRAASGTAKGSRDAREQGVSRSSACDSILGMQVQRQMWGGSPWRRCRPEPWHQRSPGLWDGRQRGSGDPGIRGSSSRAANSLNGKTPHNRPPAASGRQGNYCYYCYYNNNNSNNNSYCLLRLHHRWDHRHYRFT